MDVEIVAIGNELLLGETVDTNSAYAARRLAEIGARVSRVTIVGDDRVRMRQALAEARDRSRWVITTGGLGPTQDDLTREVVSELFDAPLEIDAEVLADVEERFRRFGYARMPESNRSQAQVPRGARVIPNRHGTKPRRSCARAWCTRRESASPLWRSGSRMRSRTRVPSRSRSCRT
jgi:nicotinamide-nucleotide amidase